jgi:hypothetical protein
MMSVNVQPPNIPDHGGDVAVVMKESGGCQLNTFCVDFGFAFETLVEGETPKRAEIDRPILTNELGEATSEWVGGFHTKPVRTSQKT